MDKNRIKGAVDQAVGKGKTVAGKVTGDRKLQAEGRAQTGVGKVESAVGKVKDAVRDVLKK
ncbi:CsbD family protein [Inquilinus sp. CA228]|uniref:CsbD family protein n=1 Tax=Inquilinus sp. CA228 TaxID=3455609 RepID=UPI003F8D53E6